MRILENYCEDLQPSRVEEELLNELGISKRKRRKLRERVNVVSGTELRDTAAGSSELMPAACFRDMVKSKD